jgi:hypothetical protein
MGSKPTSDGSDGTAVLFHDDELNGRVVETLTAGELPRRSASAILSVLQATLHDP